MFQDFVGVNEWTCKQHDSDVEFSDTLTQDGVITSLVGATVKFLMKDEHGTEVSGDADVVDEDAGTVIYKSAAGDLDVASVFKQEWEVTIAGKVHTHPSNGWNKVTVLSDLN